MGDGVFGLGSSLNTRAACISLILLILFTVFFEITTSRLDKHLAAVGMMYLNAKIKREIDYAAAIDTTELVERSRRVQLGGWRGFMPQNLKLRHDIEFKVYNMFFCDHYRFPVSAFDFPAYMREVLDRHVTSLLEVEISSWLFLCGALCVNIIRGYVEGEIGDDEESTTVEGSARSLLRSLASSSDEDKDDDGLWFFMGLGIAMLTAVSLLKFFGKRSERQLLKLMGCGDVEKCIEYLKKTEEKLLKEEEKLMDNHHKSQTLKIGSPEEEGKTQRHKRVTSGNVSTSLKSELLSAFKAGAGEDDVFQAEGGDSPSFNAKHGAHQHDPVKDDVMLGVMHKHTVGAATNAVAKVGKRVKGLSSSIGATGVSSRFIGGSPPQHHPLAIPEGSATATVSEESKKKIKRIQRNRSEHRQAEVHTATIARGALKAQMKAVYLFGSEAVVNKLLDLAMLFNCFYVAVFCANFAYVALHKDNGLGPLYFVICLVPGIATFYMCGMCVKTHSILSAIAHIDLEVVGAVVDETEDTLAVGKAAFATILDKLEVHGIDMEALHAVFDEMDENGDGTLDAKELRHCLANLGVHLPSHKFKKLFRLVDIDRKGTINFIEFFLLLYPEETDNVEKYFEVLFFKKTKMEDLIEAPDVKK
ncbi:hypothetical protein TrLO_g13394 [Triparma laevis f. longispina]|uniref:EF-hand domain-containing protein n=1 Tax=Triparma laevis f. longispina TaxID=1714387 RepID=A0A9W7FRY6_9STRA|nr:hypothetical protein TrLO_g13394 [Triparma laevis f. longispina]